VNNVSERLQLYSRLDNINNEDELTSFAKEVRDRFGLLPQSVEELINSVRLRWLGEKLGFEKLVLKNERLRGFFVSNNDRYFSSDVFGQILQFVQTHSKRCKMRDHAGKALLVVEEISSVDVAIDLFSQMESSKRSAKEILSK
jgi:transcription-repair coupling factor (superfamily II helicase)